MNEKILGEVKLPFGRATIPVITIIALGLFAWNVYREMQMQKKIDAIYKKYFPNEE